MARNNPGDDPTWQRRFLTPAKDFVVSIVVKDAEAARLTIGSAHPIASEYPSHKLAGFAPDEEGHQRAFYLASREAQEAYNYEFAKVLGGRWGPEIRQTFVLLRSGWVPATGTPSGAPPTFSGAYVWTFMEEREQRMEEPFDGLFVQVERTWRDIRTPVLSSNVDPDTGAVVQTSQEIVAAGTSGTAIDNTGTFAEVEGLNPFWAVKTVRQAAGIAGSATDGLAERVLEKHTRFYWPPVLETIFVRPVYADPGDAFSAVTGYIFYPIWRAFSYNGACKSRLTERWTKARPLFTGDANWPATGTNPYIPEPTVLLPRPISYNGVDFNVSVESCLHGAFVFSEQGFTYTEPATNVLGWPGTLIADVDVRPYLGGYMTSIVEIDAPHTSGISPTLLLGWTTLTTTSVRLTFAAAASGTTLDVSTTPDFTRGLVLDNVAVTPAATTRDVTGLTRGTYYYARIKLSGSTSNVVQFMAKTEPELAVFNGGSSIASGGALAFTSTVVGASSAITLTLENQGWLNLSNVSAALSGTDAGQWSLGTLDTVIARGDEASLVVTFTPSSSGSKTGTLTITSDDPDTPSYTISLTGTATSPEINVQYSATSYASGSTIELAGTTNVGSSTDYTLTIQNTGTGNLTLGTLNLSGTGWSIVTQPTSPVAGAGSTTMVVRFTPSAEGGSLATLTIPSNDADEATTTLYLSGQAVAQPNAALANPWGGSQATGSTFYMGGVFIGSPRTLSITIQNTGSGTLNGLAASVSAGDFTLGSLPVTALAAGASTTLAITFTPSGSAGTKTATLTITSDDPDTPSYTLSLTGQAMSATWSMIQLEQPTGTVLVDGSSTVAFGNAQVTGGTQALTFTYRNIGCANSGTLAIAMGGTHSAEFVAAGLTTPVSSSSATIGSDDFTVTFDPAGFGLRTATLTFSDSADSPNDDWLINLQGYGVPTNSIRPGQSAAVIVGQADSDDQVSTASQTVAPGAEAAAVSAGGRLAVADGSNNRVLIWNTVPTSSGTPADLVLGQTNFTDTTGGITSSKMRFPNSVAWHGENLWVTDSTNNRVLRFTKPMANGQAASLVLGQSDFTSSSSGSSSTKFDTPGKVLVHGGKLFLADTNNSRVLIWNSVPTASNTAANVAVGQTNLTNNSTGTTSTTLNFPSGVAVTAEGRLAIADTVNNRVLLYANVPTSSGAAATNVIGQANFTSSSTGLTASTLNSPFDVSCSAAGTLAVSDFNNNRVLLWYATPSTDGSSAHGMIGQQDFTSGGASTSGAAVMSGPELLTWNGTSLLVSGEAMRRTMIFHAS